MAEIEFPDTDMVSTAVTTPKATDKLDTHMTNTEILREMITILIPADISSILWMSSQTLTMMFVGRSLGSLAMAQYSVGIMVFNVCGFSIISGIGSAIDTIASQAFGRDAMSAEIGEVLQRALLINTMLIVPVILFFECVVAPLLVPIFGVEVGSGAREFIQWSPLYMVWLLVGATVRRVMLAVRAADLVVYANAAAAVAAPLANWLFTDLGVGLGTVLTLSCISFFNAMVYVVLCVYSSKMACVRVASFPCAKLLDWGEMKVFLALGIPSTIAMCAEWWAFDLQQVFTAYVSPTAVATFGVGMSILVVLFSFALGVAISCTTLVGNALGANCPQRAKQYVRVLMSCAVGLGVIVTFILYLFRHRVISLYTSDAAVIEASLEIFPILMMCHLGDTVQFALQGFYRGAGEPGRAATAVLVTLWLVGLPSSAFYCLYLGMGAKGVFCGLLTGFLFEIPLLLFFMSRWDSTELAAKASRSNANLCDEGNELGSVTSTVTGGDDAIIEVVDSEKGELLQHP